MQNPRYFNIDLVFLPLLCIGSVMTYQISAAEPTKLPEAGDATRICWVRPYAEAVKQAKVTNRLILAKPIMGGTNKPKPGGLPAGGKTDCDGSW